jgi:hypothetical protein
VSKRPVLAQSGHPQTPPCRPGATNGDSLSAKRQCN